MKKLLVATSALVAAAGSAAALDVTLGGEISISSVLNINESGFTAANWDAGFTLAAEGESMGWVYGGTLEFGMGNVVTAVSIIDDGNTTNDFQFINNMGVFIDAASVYMEGDFMGRIAVQDECGDFVEVEKVTEAVGSVDAGHCLNWTGFEVAGVEVMAAVSLDGGNSGLVIGAAGDFGGFGFAGEYDIDTENYELGLDGELSGYSVGLDVSYINGAVDEYDYSVSVGLDLMGWDATLSYSPENRAADHKDIMASFENGCLTASIGVDPVDDAIDADGLYMWEVGYECDIHDGVSVEATIGVDQDAATGDDLYGNIGATISF